MRKPGAGAKYVALTILVLVGLSNGSTLPVITQPTFVVEASSSTSEGYLPADGLPNPYGRARSMSEGDSGARVSALSGSDDALTGTTATAANGKIAFARALSISEVHVMNADGSNQVNLTNSQGFDGLPAWSPDGSKLAFVSNRDGNREIYVMNADGSNLTKLTGDPVFNGQPSNDQPTWSPDGSRIAFRRAQFSIFSGYDWSFAIYVMNADGSNPTRLTNPEFAFDFDPAWSPDGSRITFTRYDNNEEIYVINSDGSNLTRLTNSPGFDNTPAWSPDGARIAFTSERDGNAEVYVMASNGGSLMRLTNNTHFDGLPAWSPDGTRIAFTSSRDGNDEIYVMNADGNNQTRVTSNPAADRDPHWSPDGVRIAFATYQFFNDEIYVMNGDGSSQLNLTNHPGRDFSPAWSPDGSRIAFASDRDGNSEIYNSEIYVMNADGSNQTRLTSRPAFDYAPDWSPDGARIVFAGSDGIYVMNADGSNQTRLIDPGFFDGTPAWSPDGSRIAFTHNAQICVINANGGNLTCLTRATLFEYQVDPAWSPDGTRISYTTIPIFSDQVTSDDEILVMDAAGGNIANLTNTHHVIDGQSAWSPDGARIAFVSYRDGNDEIYMMNADGGNPTRITNNLDAINSAPDWQVLPATPNSNLQFSAAAYSVGEEAGSVAITVIRTGDTSGTATVTYASSDGAAFTNCDTVNGAASSRCDYAPVFGTLRFAAGEVTKDISLSVVDDAYTEGPETLNLTLSNPAGANLSAQSAATLTINDNDNSSAANPNDGPAFFVRQHYLDFLNREPDPSGLAFWTNQIASCGADQQCVELKRINVSAAFFLSIEFQETGYLACRAYKAAYGDATSPGLPGTVPVIRLAEFLADSQRLGEGVRVGIGDWQERLEANKQAYALEFVQRQRFSDAFPSTMSADAFVTKLDQQAGGVLSADEEVQLVASLAPDPSEAQRRARVLRAVAEDADLRRAEFTRAFVLMQYYGYLRRNPDDPQDTDFRGWEFWLNKLNQHNGNFVSAEMVKSFLASIEYRQRFGQP